MKWVFLWLLRVVTFERRRSVGACAVAVALSFMADWHWKNLGLFACSGAILTIAGLLLSVKHSLHFHLNLSRQSIFNQLAGAGPWGSVMTKDDEIWMDGILADEICAVALIVIGTLLWAYGGYLIGFINPAPQSC